MGGDRPQNRKAQYKKNKQREEGGGGGGGGGGERRKGDGKPVKVKGMTYEKQVPAFIAKMMQSGAHKDRSKPDIAAHDVLPTMSERAARGGSGEQWPSREQEDDCSKPAAHGRGNEQARAQAAAAARAEQHQRRREALSRPRPGGVTSRLGTEVGTACRQLTARCGSFLPSENQRVSRRGSRQSMTEVQKANRKKRKRRLSR